MSPTLQRALDSLLQRGSSLPAGTRQAVVRSLENHAGAISENILQTALDKLFEGLRSVANPQQETRILQPETPNAKPETTSVTVGDTPATVRAKVLEVLKPFGSAPELNEALNLDFKISVAADISAGSGRFVADQTNVDAYPAWELKRVYAREVPRGEEPKNPSDPWPTRWMKAAMTLGEEGDLLIGILESTGRMIALKSSRIWQAIGDGVGGYDDTLGNPFAPFAFNSGFDTEGVSRKECIELGLLKKDEQPRGSDFDFSQLIALPDAA